MSQLTQVLRNNAGTALLAVKFSPKVDSSDSWMTQIWVKKSTPPMPDDDTNVCQEGCQKKLEFFFEVLFFHDSEESAKKNLREFSPYHLFFLGT